VSDTPGSRRGWYGPTVLLGLTGALLAAVAGSQDWARSSGEASGIAVHAAVQGSDAAPLASALALVALAAWGVILVSRGGMRRLVAVAGGLAAAGVLVAVVDAWDGAQDAALDALAGKQATGDVSQTALTVWYYLAGVGALLTLAGFVAAAVLAARWPAMGSRYDAPGARAEQPATDQDMWRALDEGRDPTS
jgi:uncharacterized membrane protein (TIGR02234 family)